MPVSYEYREWDMLGSANGGSLFYPMKWHRHAEICLVMEGELTLTVEEGSYLLTPGDIYVVFPNVLHAVSMTHTSKRLWMFSPELFPALPELLTSKPKCPVLPKEKVTPLILYLLCRCVLLHIKDKKRYRKVLLTHTAALMQELMMKLELINSEKEKVFTQRLTGYLMDNFRSDITLESTAKALGYSKYYISHMVAELYECNFRTLVNNHRISAAQEALMDKGKDIWQIAYTCGFQNQSTFNRAFVKLCGITPTEYRRRRLCEEIQPDPFTNGDVD